MFLNVNLMAITLHFNVILIQECAGALMNVEKNALDQELNERQIAVSQDFGRREGLVSKLTAGLFKN